MVGTLLFFRSGLPSPVAGDFSDARVRGAVRTRADLSVVVREHADEVLGDVAVAVGAAGHRGVPTGRRHCEDSPHTNKAVFPIWNIISPRAKQTSAGRPPTTPTFVSPATEVGNAAFGVHTA